MFIVIKLTFEQEWNEMQMWNVIVKNGKGCVGQQSPVKMPLSLITTVQNITVIKLKSTWVLTKIINIFKIQYLNMCTNNHDNIR